MDFGFSEEQELLRATAREFLAEHAPIAHVRAMIEDARGYSPELWRRMAELGWTGLIFPERYGGAALGYVDLAALVEELGRALTPAPYLPTLIAGCAILEAGDDAQRAAWLPRICDGSAVATLALAEETGSEEPDAIRLEARPARGGFQLHGRKRFVPDAHVADLFVVVARTGGSGARGLGAFVLPRDTEGIQVEPLPGIDPLRRLSELRLDAHVPAAALLGGDADAWPSLERVLDRARVMLCAEMIGGAEKCLEDAVAHARSRVQFGRPIGANQAIQHKCADMLFALESAKAIVYYAAWAASEGAEEAGLAAAMGKAYTSDAYRRVTADNIQIHGGVGFTWEYDCHLYFKRAKSDEVWLGDGRRNRDRVAQLLEL